MAETIVAENRWVKRLASLRKQEFERERKLRARILKDDSLPDLEKAVLGLLGSEEKLREYKVLASKIGNNALRPIVQVDEVTDDRVSRANAGFLTGEVLVKFGYPLSFGENAEDREIESAIISAVVDPAVAYLYSRGYGRAEEESFFEGQDSSMYDNGSKQCLIELATFRRLYRGPKNIDDSYPIVEIVQPRLYIGREAIYGSQLFNVGLNSMMNALEELNLR